MPIHHPSDRALDPDPTTDLTPVDPVLATERAHLLEARASLVWMRERAEEITDVSFDELAAHALGVAKARRLESLADDGVTPPFFGRTDREAEDPADGDGETFHIGRRHVRDPEGDPLVIDWRAPMAMPFYRATMADPQGVRLRRRFGFADGELTSYEDENLVASELAPGESRILLEEIERPRVGPMRDIVATIQPDQDEIVRAPLDHNLCVQGAPGTGKTAVGLHRAAYLLYTYPERLKQAKVLIVGPNRAFLSYIAQVLPALGEYDVDQNSVAELTATVRVRGEDTPEVGTLKGDARLAQVLHKALYGGISKPVDSVLVPLAGRRYRVSEQRVRRYVDDLRRSDVAYIAARERLAMGIAEDARRQKEAGGGSPTDPEVRRAARSAEVRALVEQVWPTVTAPGLVFALFTEPGLLARAARGILSDEEQQALLWPTFPRSVAVARWSPADSVLIDEVAGLLDRVRSYGHVVLDEAQDLSPMQCRAVARRCSTGSVTVLGDVAQGTSPWATEDWHDTLRFLGKEEATIEPLTLGYRVPGEVIAYANRLLPSIAPGLEASTSVRRGHNALLLTGVAGPSDLDSELVVRAKEMLAQEGSVGVICADRAVRRTAGVLEAAGLDVDVLADAAAGPRLSVVAATLAKGLEFDHVIVVEPADIVEAEPRGLRRLYVCLTRAVSQLAVLHAKPLPAALEPTSGESVG